MEQTEVDAAFQTIVRRPELHSADVDADLEVLRHDIRRIASALFCGVGIDPSIVDFAKRRTALHWGLDEEVVDQMISARLLSKAARLMADLQWLGAKDPHRADLGAAA